MKRNIKSRIKIIDNSQDDMKIKYKYLFICGVYVSPASSGYTKRTGIDKKVFQKLESDIVKLTAGNYVMIIGVINAYVNHNYLDFINNEESGVM